ncbi:MAG: M15 family metallopeptidase [Acidimicrobiia bacterium]|nr:M15 family metallopeptidase [Acidimicrobiia bacterium]
MRTLTRRTGPLLLAAVAVLATAVALPAGAATPIHPENRPNSLSGQVNGEVAASELVRVGPGCLAARGTGPSLGLLFSLARAEGVGLGAEQCYRPLQEQVVIRQQALSGGNPACVASVGTSPTGKPVGRSMHGWGKAADLEDPDGTLTFGSPAYAFLKREAGPVGWNHPGWAEPGGSACPEPWHWEWVGDGGNLGLDPIRADVVGLLPSADGQGYATVTGLGGVAVHGDAVDRGSMARVPIAWVVVGAAPTPTGGGYWLVAADGGLFAFGDAGFFGSTGHARLNELVVGMAATPTGDGYWLVAADGGVFAFGDAGFLGSTGDVRLNRPVMGMAPTPTGDGYWLVASDGGVFTFGDARFLGSTGDVRLNRPVMGMAPTPTGDGYWLVASDGGVFTFGDARFFGSAGDRSLDSPVVGVVPTATGNGYWLVAADGTVLAFGDASWFGDG